MADDMALTGVKVLDFTWVGVGPITIKYLADHGAEVVHVESVSRPDILRLTPPFKEGKPGINRSQFPANYNTSKYGLGINMAKPGARELIRRIITDWQPDIIAESFTPKAMRNWGLDYQSVRKLKPDIIYFSGCQQGRDWTPFIVRRLRAAGRSAGRFLPDNRVAGQRAGRAVWRLL